MAVALEEDLERQRDAAQAIRQQAPEKIAGGDEAFLSFAHDVCNQAERLFLIWGLTLLRLQKGGVSAKRQVSECDLLLLLIDPLKEVLQEIASSLARRQLPDQLANPFKARVLWAQRTVPDIEQAVRELRERIDVQSRSTASLAEVKERFERTEAEGNWIRLPLKK